MKEDLTPLEGDVLAVLHRMQSVDDVPAGARDRILTATLARIAMVPGGGSGGGVETASPAALRAPVAASFVARNPWLSLTAAMVLGGAIGATARGPIDGPAPRVTTSATTLPEATSRAAATTVAPWTELAAKATASATTAPSTLPRSPTPAEAPAAPGQELAAESAILDIARTAIARGEPDHALAAVARHASTFPQGVLREEREALAVKAFVLAGRGDEARARADKFRAKYPASLFLPAIESSLRSIP